MNTEEIYSILSSDDRVRRINFLGVFPINKIPKVALENNTCCAVVNTKPNTHEGEHWVCFAKKENGSSVYFDSFGYPPYNLPEIGDVLEQSNNWIFNDVQLQSPYSTVCGQYVIFFLTHYARGITPEHIIELLNDNGDTFANDAFIFNYIKNKYHSVDTSHLKIVDLPYMFKQSANYIKYF